MKHTEQHGRYLVFPLLILALLLVPARVTTRVVHAQEAQMCGPLLNYLDLDEDGMPEAAVIQCRFGPDGADQVIVVDGSDDMDWETPWEEVVDFENDAWLFDHQADGKIDLIMAFHQEEESGLVADLYDDRNADGEVAYRIVAGRIEITENASWTLRVIPAGGWWTRGERVNFNLRILIDGDVEGMFMSEYYRQGVLTDGVLDFEIKVHDVDKDGRPDYEIREHYIPRAEGSVGLGIHAMVNWADDEAPLDGGFDLWPYLDLYALDPGGSRVPKSYNSSPPPLKFDPETGQLEGLGEFVASRGNEHNCFYYSTVPWAVEAINDANFEAPFCFYDLAQDRDGLPELQIRQTYWRANDYPFLQGQFPQPVQWIRYSWDQDNSQTWRYGLGLAGRRPVESVTAIGDYAVRTLPYSRFPEWVTGQTWDMAMFVEVMDRAYWTSEGIYAVSGLEGLEYQYYLTGWSDQYPAELPELESGFRFEGASEFQQQPRLYFSAVDRRLHLRDADYGIWNVDGIHTLNYESLGKTGEIDSWTLSQEGQPQQRLFATSEMLIHTRSQQITLQASTVPPGLFETLPPANHEEWEALGRLLEMHERDFAPDDFEAMLQQFAGPSTRIEGATLRDFRHTTGGFRFVLALLPGFRVAGGEDQVGVRDLEPGEYAATYEGVFEITPLTPPALRIEPAAGRVTRETPVAYLPGEVAFSVHNDGLEDAETVLVTASAGKVAQELTALGTQTVTVLAGESTQVRFPWTPPAPGAWHIQAEARIPLHTERAPAVAEQTLEALPAQQLGFHDAVTAAGLAPEWAILALLIAIVTAGGMIAIIIWRLARFEEASGGQSS
ncbi:MAG: hypothetical protein JXB35_12905 [Anaerolineae bacterium]|nr:hypothetical protein [Anaerolineae bacterium]